MDSLKEHRVIFRVLIFSFIISLLEFIITVIVVDLSGKFAFVYFIPFILVFIISVCCVKIYQKHPVFAKIFSIILNFLIVLIVQLVYFGFIFLFSLALNHANKAEEAYFEPSQYDKALKSIVIKNNIKHFPKQIPYNAKDIKLMKTANYYWGTEEIFTSFVIDKEYIDNKLKNLNYKKIEKNPSPDNYYSRIRYAIYDNDFKDNSNYVYFILDDDFEHKIEYGIAIDYKNNRIVFYYALME